VRSLAIVALVIVGCAHDPSTFMPRAQPDDDRIVVAEFCVEWEPKCQRFQQRVLASAEVQQALREVRFVQFDRNTIKGSAAYDYFGQSQLAMGYATANIYARLLVFLAIVDNRVVRRYNGSPFDTASFIHFLDEVAPLGGSERSIEQLLAAAPDDPQTLARVAAWYDAHARRDDGKRYWDKLGARTDISAELRAEASWRSGAATRRGTPNDPHAALRFAEEHVGTSWALHALDVAVVFRKLPASELAAPLRVNFERAGDNVDAVATLAWTALGAGLLDDALVFAERGVRLTRSASPRELATLAQVYLARKEHGKAVAILELAVAQQPDSQILATELDGARHGGGLSQDRFEVWRNGATSWAWLFYGGGP
jgi:tetratricopeptide (TPR) repeat protein